MPKQGKKKDREHVVCSSKKKKIKHASMTSQVHIFWRFFFKARCASLIFQTHKHLDFFLLNVT
jgi:hypothetical protein